MACGPVDDESMTGGTASGRTPVGEFSVEHHIHGLRASRLGELHDPVYFWREFAIYGAPHVPTHPASHGCVRVSMVDVRWLIDRVPDGMAVHVHGDTHAFIPRR